MSKIKKQFISYGHQSIDFSDIKAVSAVLKSDWLTQGPKVAEFERALANYCGAGYAAAVSSGTAALHLAYLAAGLKKGDEAITTPNTFVATTNMLIAVGAKPIFCDIRVDNCNIDENKIESLITKRTKAVVPVHFAGHPCEMDAILKLARRRKLLVIEDACHALGAFYHGRKIGSLGDMTVFSFHPVKTITTGEGGAILTNSKKLYEKLVLLRNHGIVKDKNGFNVMKSLGYNYRVTDIQCALGLSQLEKIDSFLKKRRRVASRYKEFLSDIPEIILPFEPEDCRSSWHIYVVRTKNPRNRLPLYKYLKRRGIGVNFHYPPVYSHPYYRRLGFKPSCPEAEKYAETAITLPLYAQLSKKDIGFAAAEIKKFFQRRK